MAGEAIVKGQDCWAGLTLALEGLGGSARNNYVRIMAIRTLDLYSTTLYLERDKI